MMVTIIHDQDGDGDDKASHYPVMGDDIESNHFVIPKTQS